MNKGKFEVGMVIPAWTPKIGTKMAESALVVGISDDRRTIWLVDADKVDTFKLDPERQQIADDPRFGEKVVAYADFLHPYMRVFRADKATGQMEVPQKLRRPQPLQKSA